MSTWRDTRVQGSLDLQRPEDDRTGNLLPRRARQHGALHVLQQVGPAQLGVEFVASSLRYDDAANTIKMGGYGIVNLTLDWPFAKGWSLLVRGNNVFDKNYQLAADYSTGGAQVFAGGALAAVKSCGRHGASRCSRDRARARCASSTTPATKSRCRARRSAS